jgi:predicted component of type VI protein secretion system
LKRQSYLIGYHAKPEKAKTPTADKIHVYLASSVCEFILRKIMRVTIRQSLHPFISDKAQQLGINDHAEVVNFLLLQILQSSMLSQAQSSGSQDTQ